MMLASSALSFAPMAPTTTVSTTARSAAPAMETKADLVALANKLNPVVGFWCAPHLCLCPLGSLASGAPPGRPRSRVPSPPHPAGTR